MLIKYIEEFINSMIRSLTGKCLIFGIKFCILLKKLPLVIEYQNEQNEWNTVYSEYTEYVFFWDDVVVL